MDQLPNDPDFLQLLREFPRFHAQGGKILRMRHEVAKLSYLAKQEGRQDKLEQLEQRAEQLNELYHKWSEVNSRIRGIERALAKVGIHATLGIVPVIPVVVGVSITAALVGMTYVVTQSLHQRRLLEGIKDGWLTPEQAAEVSQSTNPFSGMLQFGAGGLGLALAAVVAYVGWRMVK